jgi:hypothetical protein
MISGDIVGIKNFTCETNPCQPLPLPYEGIGTVNFTANSSTGQAASGSVTYYVDYTSPDMSITPSGIIKNNGWYVTPTTFTVSASDNISGVDYTLYSIDDGANWAPYPDPLTLNDGQYLLKFSVSDVAGNMNNSGNAQTVKVDTITPNLDFAITGSMRNGWYVSNPQVNATASDAGSGIDTVLMSIDGGINWVPYTTPVTLQDGYYKILFHATDKAGNETTSATKEIQIDTIPPIVDMPESISLGDTLYYYLEDPPVLSGKPASGLYIYRAVIEDEDEKYKKVVWLEDIKGYNKLESDILWDGKFADGTQAKPGDYYITLKISDAAGNETWNTTTVTVDAWNSLVPIASFTPPTSTTGMIPDTSDSPSAPVSTSSEISSAGGVYNGIKEDMASKSTGNTNSESLAWTVPPVTNKPAEIPTTGILFGAAATALLGSTLAEWERQREEDRKRRAAEDGPSTYAQVAKAYQAVLDNTTANLIKLGVDPVVARNLANSTSQNGTIHTPSYGIYTPPSTLNEQEQDPVLIWDNKSISPITGQSVTLISENTTLSDIAPGGFSGPQVVFVDNTQQQALEEFRAEE